MQIKKIIMRQIKMNMKFEFSTSFGTVRNKEFILLEAIDENGVSGWGESTAFSAPWYNEETVKTNWHILEDFLIPCLLHKQIDHPYEVQKLLSNIRRNNMAKATIEGAIWDLYAKRKKQTLAATLGGKKKEIDVGISIGIQKNNKQLINLIKKAIDEGYKRVKIKIKPGHDVEVIRAVRNQFPTLPLTVDANSAYRLDDIQHLQALDQFQLMMIEQPLAYDDIVDHATLQKQIKTPICLDESILSYEDARKAIQLGSCKIINIKISRVGGLTEAKKIHDLCMKHGIQIWCGGMLEAGVGRAHNIALTTLAHFTLPGDTAASSHYWEKDIIQPDVIVNNGKIVVPTNPGIGYDIDMDTVRKATVYEQIYK